MPIAAPASEIVSEVYAYGGKSCLTVSLPAAGKREHREFDTPEEASEYRETVLATYAPIPTPFDEEDGEYLWPDNVRWIASYAVKGGSEGHYVHVDLIVDYPHTVLGSLRIARGVFLAKTFRGMAHAQAIAGRIAELLGS